MKVSIYGVGRSMTKSVALQTILLLSTTNKEIYLNYEPLYWKDRYARHVCNTGIATHQTTPIFLENEKADKQLMKFLAKLHNRESEHIITKFIRACGRMDEFERHLNSDLIVLCIRDVYSVLSSVFQGKWDLLGLGLKHIDDTKRFLTWAKETNDPIIGQFLKHTKNRIDINALYWFSVNLKALESSKKMAVITKENINDYQQIISKVTGEGVINELYSKIPGHFIHNDQVLKETYKPPRMIDRIYELYNSLSKIRNSKYIYPADEEIGSIVETTRLEGEYNYKEISEFPGVGGIIVPENVMYSEMQAIVFEKICSRK